MAKLTLNRAQWEAVPESDRAMIIERLKKVGSLADQEIILDDAGPKFDVSKKVILELNPLGGFFCELKCGTAFTAACAVCAEFSGPAFAGCMLLSSGAYDSCKKDC